MSEQTPPIPYPLNPIYNPNDWISPSGTAIDVAYLNANYLKFPNAQGLETLQAINVNGISNFLNVANFSANVNVGTQGIDCSGVITIVDYTPSSNVTEILTMSQVATQNQCGFCLNSIDGAYSPITKNNDVILVAGGVLSTPGVPVNKPFALTTWSTVTNGFRLDETEFKLGLGGISGDPTNRITFTQTSMTFNASNNNSIVFNRSINLNGAGNYIKFPDNTQQTTAYTTSALKIGTASFTSNQTLFYIPSNVYKMDMKIVARGGDCGSSSSSGGSTYFGGSGAGGQTIIISNFPVNTISGSYPFNITFVDTVGSTIGYVQVQDAFDNTIIARAYNGGKGNDAVGTTVGTGGVVSPFSGATLPTQNSNYGITTALQGSNGSSGQVNSGPTGVGLARGCSPNTFSQGNGRLTLNNTWPSAVVVFTYYYI
jgi:hypothetical protein